ncbi:AraC family transcriptional regulator [Vibrio sp. RE86]|uniref:AraC family transcriptional regulator n=1 Tax=Vibrio sp. RE86 TaxID=2607605 RepID=UPI001493B37F|nr:AraC family transcriptional regulator [Vibrio sp. RE86]NOH78881.1 AraC family transcriptional regulator [Vibrio sp. RE86]
MHYAISYQTELNEFLVCTSRKKSLKHQLICVREGLVLVKLGKQEHAIEPGQHFWLPFDTLTSLTMTPNSRVSRVELSSRVAHALPQQAGFVSLNELTHALLNRLESYHADREKHIDLLAVLRQELTELTPKLTSSKLAQRISQWRPDTESDLPAELQLALRVREANKLMQSGKKRPFVVETLFEGNDTLFASLEKAVLGR